MPLTSWTPFAGIAGLLLLAGCGMVANSSAGRATSTTPTTAAAAQPWEQPVRKAICGPLDRPETGLQGDVPAADRASGRSQEGYNCNLERVGQWQGDGAGWVNAWYDDCAYYTTRGDTTRKNYGTVVVDASQRSNPFPTEYLQTKPMIDPWESLKVHEQRGLLAAQDGTGGTGGSEFVVYNVAGDCRHPELLFNGPMGETSGHEANWAQTGLTYWSSGVTNYSPFDVTDPAHPVYMMTWTPPTGTHGLSTNSDGTRGYFTARGFPVASGNRNGLIIADVSDIEHRKPDGEIRIVGELDWTDGSENAQMTIPIKIKGTPYVIVSDEVGGTGKACGSGQSPFGFARLIDISDEKNPKLVSKLMLETHDPQNCPVIMTDFANGQYVGGYDSHYCGVDDPNETTAVACAYFNSGIRVFDVRNPYLPREIAYFNPPAQFGRASQLQGSHHATDNGTANNNAALTADWCTAAIRFKKDTDGTPELWTTCQDNGFMVLKFTNGVWPFK